MSVEVFSSGGKSYGRGYRPECKEEKAMAFIKMIPEEEATGKVKEIYEEIKSQLGIDFVPNLYKVMASKSGYLEANWNKVKTVMIEPGKLDRLTKEIIAVAVSAVNSCEY
jgi:hypothetical protein